MTEGATELDCVVVGGGPAGLTAAIYLARYRQRLAVFDCNQSRAALIPRSHNCPGFPGGISGTKFLSRLREQLQQYDIPITSERVTRIERDETFGFRVITINNSLAARTVLLATGITDIQPAIGSLRKAIQEGHIRLCPVCDGYEVIDRDVAVFGPADRAVEKALFLRPYTSRLTVLLTANSVLDEKQRRMMDEAGIALASHPVSDMHIDADSVAVELTDGSRLSIDVLYPALGSEVHAQLAVELGAQCSPEGCLITDAHQLTTVPGLYAAGDIVNELNQICVATGHAAIAATHIYNSLRSTGRPHAAVV